MYVSVYMYVYVCMCLYICLCICMYVSVYMYVSVCMYVSVYMYVYVCMCLYICMCLYMCMYVYVYMYLYVWMYVFTFSCEVDGWGESRKERSSMAPLMLGPRNRSRVDWRNGAAGPVRDTLTGPRPASINLKIIENLLPENTNVTIKMELCEAKNLKRCIFLRFSIVNLSLTHWCLFIYPPIHLSISLFIWSVSLPPGIQDHPPPILDWVQIADAPAAPPWLHQDHQSAAAGTKRKILNHFVRHPPTPPCVCEEYCYFRHEAISLQINLSVRP